MTLKYVGNLIYIVFVIGIIIALFLGIRKREKIMIALNIQRSIIKNRIKTLIIVLGLIFIFISLLGPQALKGSVELKQKNLDIYVLMDVSKSMLVEDVVPNRLEKEKEVVRQMIEKLDGDRIGFIPFASSAYVQMPLTNDYQLANMFLEVVDTDMIGGGGSNVGKAIQLANDSFERMVKGDKVILIISDGEEHNEESEKILKEIMTPELKVYTIGVGTKEGGLIPIYNNQTKELVGYKKDENNNPVISSLHDSTLKNLASIGMGDYYLSDINSEEVQSFLLDISLLEKTEKKAKEIKQYKQWYQWFLGPGLVLLIIGYIDFAFITFGWMKKKKVLKEGGRES